MDDVELDVFPNVSPKYASRKRRIQCAGALAQTHRGSSFSKLMIRRTWDFVVGG